MVAHVGGRQGEERLAGLIRRNGRNVSRAHVRLGRLCFAPLLIGAAVRAAVAAVCAGSHVARVRQVRTVRVGLFCLGVLFRMVVIAAARAGGAALLVCTFAARRLAVWRGLSTGGLTLLVLLRVSWWSGAGSRAGGNGDGWVGLLATGWISISADVTAGYSEATFIAAAAAGYCVSATVTAFVVGFEAGFVLLRRPVVAELQARDRRAIAGLLVPLTAGGAQLGGGWRVWFTNLRAGLCQQGQWTLLSVKLQSDMDTIIHKIIILV